VKDNMLKLYVKATTALKSDEGATAVEYAIIVALIAVVAVVAVRLLGTRVTAAFNGAAAAIP
jgi:pilus assembly protein Flp/PilA